MKLTILALAVILLADPAVAGDAGTCYTISDPDARVLCLARAHQDPARCYAIKRDDLRAECRAETRTQQKSG